MLGILVRFPNDLRNPNATDLRVQAAAQRGVDLTVKAVLAGGTAEQRSLIRKWEVTVDPRISVTPKRHAAYAETKVLGYRTQAGDDVTSVNTIVTSQILGVAESTNTVYMTFMQATGGDAALLAIFGHEFSHGTAKNRLIPESDAAEQNASEQAIRLGNVSPDVDPGSIEPYESH